MNVTDKNGNHYKLVAVVVVPKLGGHEKVCLCRDKENRPVDVLYTDVVKWGW